MTTLQEAEQHIAAAAAESRPIVAFAHRAEALRLIGLVVKGLEADQSDADEGIQEMLIAQGVGKLTLTEPALTVYLERRLWAGIDRAEGESTDAAYARACEALVANGLGDLVHTRFNTNSLSAHLRELEREGGEVELGPLAGAIKVSTVTKVRTRKT